MLKSEPCMDDLRFRCSAEVVKGPKRLLYSGYVFLVMGKVNQTLLSQKDFSCHPTAGKESRLLFRIEKNYICLQQLRRYNVFVEKSFQRWIHMEKFLKGMVR